LKKLNKNMKNKREKRIGVVDEKRCDEFEVKEEERDGF